MTMKRSLLLFCLAALPLTGCAHAQAKTAADMPALAMPAPPPRDVELGDVDAPPPVTPPPAEPARTPPADPAKPDEAAKGPATLQTTPATAENEVERGIRSSLQRATADLNRVDYR